MNNILLYPHSVSNNIWGKRPEWDKKQPAKKYEIPALRCLSIAMNGELVYCMGLLFGI